MTSNFVYKFLHENRKNIPHEQNISKVPLMLCYAFYPLVVIRNLISGRYTENHITNVKGLRNNDK